MEDSAHWPGSSTAEYIRSKSTGTVLPSTKIPPERRSLFLKIGWVANNINQLARKANSGKHYSRRPQRALQEIKSALNAITLKMVNHEGQDHQGEGFLWGAGLERPKAPAHPYKVQQLQEHIRWIYLKKAKKMGKYR